MTATRRCVLDAQHRALGARMTPFGGWEMPLQYTGVLEEHRACRSRGVVFDVSHLGSVMLEGPGAFEAIQRLFTNDLGRIEPGRAQYTLLLDEADAHAVDDLIIWWLGPERFHVIPNASNTAAVLDALREEAGTGTSVNEVTGERALLAVQGPAARAALSKVSEDLAQVGHFEVGSFPFAGVDCLVGGTGYTGEDGVEVLVPSATAGSLFEALLDAGLSPAGLGARDTLRLEMGYPLHGHELGPGITPNQAGLNWAVGWDKATFRGREALAREREAGVARRLCGLLAEGRQAPRSGCSVMRGDEVLGEVTSGNFSPTLERGIGLALLDATHTDLVEVTIDVRGRSVPARVMRPPFIPPR